MRFASGKAYLVVAPLLLLLLGACGSSDSESAPRSPGPSVNESEPSADQSEADSNAGSATSVEIIDTDFMPRKITIDNGTTVNWEQVGDQPHSVTAADGSFDSSPDCGPIDSDKCLGQGDKFSHVFDQSGKFTYYCRVHGLPDGTGMVGTIVVK